MQQLLNEFNQDKINKIASKYKNDAALISRQLRDYEMDINWIKAAVMHMDHLRQNKRHLMRMSFIMKIVTNSNIVASYFVRGDWQWIDYLSFVRLVNCFEPNAQMRQAQQKYAKEESGKYTPQEQPVVVQDDDNFLMMRAETAKAAVEAKKRIEALTKQKYTWCISDENESKNLFMRYRNENGKPVTAYFVLDKNKQPSDAWHTFVIHMGQFKIKMTNALNKDPRIMSDAAINSIAQGLDVSKLIVQPFADVELTYNQLSTTHTGFFHLTYDEKTKLIQSTERSYLTENQYAMLDGKQQYLFLHYLSPARAQSIAQAAIIIKNILAPFYGGSTLRLATVAHYFNRVETKSIEQLLQELPHTKNAFNNTWSNEAKEYYVAIVQRAIDNAAQIIQKQYI